jgi:hypothetical protein
VGINQTLQGRPSVPLAAAVSRVRALGSEPARQFNPIAASGPSGTGRFAGSHITVAARNAVRLLADHRIAGKGTSAPTAMSGCVGGFQQPETKQINVVTAYRRNGVGGAPPRGRPN